MKLQETFKSLTETQYSDEETSILFDINYIRKSASLVTEALNKGCDVMQLPNGDIVISEFKPVTFTYKWDSRKNKMVRSQPGAKNKKMRQKKTGNMMDNNIPLEAQEAANS